MRKICVERGRISPSINNLNRRILIIGKMKNFSSSYTVRLKNRKKDTIYLIDETYCIFLDNLSLFGFDID